MKIACLLADGFEDIEALGTSALLRRAGYQVDFFSVNGNDKVTGSYKTVVTDLLMMNSLLPHEYDALFIPGGRAAYFLRENEEVRKIVREFHKLNKWLFSICAGPTVFGLLGLLENKKYISFPGTEKEMGEQAIRVEKKAVSDGKIITGKSAGAVYDFVFEIVKNVEGEEALENLKKRMYY